MGALDILRAVFAGLLILLLPGLAWSFVLLHKRTITWLERVVASVGLSMALLVVTLFVANRFFRVSINLRSSAVIVLLLVTVALLVALLQRRRGLAFWLRR